MANNSGSLTERINTLELQIISRHRRARTVAAGCKRKITAWIVSPVTLLEAFGIGVVMERTNHHRGWSLPTVVNATSAGIRLLLAISTPAHSVNENSNQKSSRDFTRH